MTTNIWPYKTSRNWMDVRLPGSDQDLSGLALPDITVPGESCSTGEHHRYSGLKIAALATLMRFTN
jgi:hypothetical protein